VERERGQSTVEWVGLLLVVSLLLAALVAAGVRVPGASLARAIAAKVICAVAQAEHCGDEPTLIATYGSEVGRLVRRHMPALVFERGSHALPVDFRRCRASACGDGPEQGLVRRTDRGLPVTAFVHVIDCRPEAAEASEAAGVDCSGERAGNLYLQYWTYYANSATLRGVPVVGAKGYHEDDWESTQVRIRPGGEVDARASSHNGYNHDKGAANWGSDAGIGPLKDIAEAIGSRPHNGWGPETHILLVSGGSHAGNIAGAPNSERSTPGRGVHLVPLEPIANSASGIPGAPTWQVRPAGAPPSFAIPPPWRKHVWRDPEAEDTR
jgi:hypothetical protein